MFLTKIFYWRKDREKKRMTQTKVGDRSQVWIKHLNEVRQFYRRYEIMLSEYLKKNNIAVERNFTTGLDKTGRPKFFVENKNIGMIYLRDDECCIFVFKARGGLFAMPNNGIGLRYLVPSHSPEINDFLASEGDNVLSVVSDGDNCYILKDNGHISSTNKDLDGVLVFYTLEQCKKIVKEYFTEEQIQRAVDSILNEKIPLLSYKHYYDTKEKVFFSVCVEGNCYHGYEVTYLCESKEKLMGNLLKYHFTMREFEEECHMGNIPILIIVERLEDSKKKDYQPPENFGYGTYFV